MIIYASILIKRENIMAGGRVIRVGDMTTHGGSVIEGDPTMIINGRAAARVGDLVACPVCLGVYPIIEGNPGLTSNGKPIAYEGCRTACGAQLILKENATFIHNVPLGGATSAPQTTGKTKEDDQCCKGRFKVIDKNSGRPRSFQKIEINCSDGQEIKCTTDKDGYTPIIKTEKPETVVIKLAEEK